MQSFQSPVTSSSLGPLKRKVKHSFEISAVSYPATYYIPEDLETYLAHFKHCIYQNTVTCFGYGVYLLSYSSPVAKSLVQWK